MDCIWTFDHQVPRYRQIYKKQIFRERNQKQTTQPLVGAFGDAGNLENAKVQSIRDAKQPLDKQVDLEEKENVGQPIKKKKTRGTRGGKKLREKREQRELRERNRKIGTRF